MSRSIQDQTQLRPAPAAPPATSWLQDPREAFTELALRTRLIGPGGGIGRYGIWGWLLPLLAAVIGGILRFVRLGDPHTLVFDETYYVKDAYSYLLSGYERNWPDKANDSFNVGNPSVILSTPEYVVHPPVGKWMIAFGMELFGSDNSFGWRFSAALTGTVSILLIALIAQKLFASPILGAVAGLLTAVDGTHLVMSRTSILDIFLMFWVVAAFGALLLDRDDGRRRLAARLAAQSASSPGGIPSGRLLHHGPWLGLRPWRLAAALCLALAVGTKWSALAFILVFAILIMLWDVNARRVAGIRHWIRGGLLRDTLPAVLVLLPVMAAAYLATWTGWFLSSDAYDRNWAQQHPTEGWHWLPKALVSLAEYHRSAYAFHQGLSADHPYKSNAWTWLFMGRPTVFLRDTVPNGTGGCHASECVSAITTVGNPLIWWGAALALVVLLFYWVGRRDWRAGAILSGIAAGYLPWFMYPNRTTFFFYAISFEPFLVLAVVYVLGLVLGRRTDPPWRRTQGLALVGIFVVAVLIVSAFFLPVWTAQLLPFGQWNLRVWMPSWN